MPTDRDRTPAISSSEDDYLSFEDDDWFSQYTSEEEEVSVNGKVTSWFVLIRFDLTQTQPRSLLPWWSI